MLELKNKNGITLIALIITIIVMLILVGVTVSVSLNGGLFDKAKDAANQTQIAADADSLQAAALGAMGTDGKVDRSKITGFTRNEDGTFTSSNGYRFTVDDNGNVTYVGEGAGGGSGSETESRLGAYVTYKGLDWRVINASGDSVELLSANAIGEATVGTDEGDDNLRKAAYDNSETAILDACEAATGITSNIRSVGIADREVAEELGLLNIGTAYWVNYKEKIVTEDTQGPSGLCDMASYVAYYVTSSGSIGKEQLFAEDMTYGNTYNGTTYTKPVRPVVTVSAELFDNATGNGSSGQPYVIAD